MPAPVLLRSSGDLLADRRYEYARAAFDEKDFEAAADLARQVLERAPDFAAAWALLGRADLERGMTEAAEAALHRALRLEPQDALGVRLDLSRLGVVATEAAITEGYVEALFDDYAPKFERHLVEILAYRGPERIAGALRGVMAERDEPFFFANVFDLGCGTGLMAKALDGAFAAIHGVDLSARMLERAARTQLYEELRHANLVDFLAGRAHGEADLVVAADVFIYLAALETVFREARRVLREGGLFAFTVQTHEGEGVILGADSRYAHARGEVEALAAAEHFAVRRFTAASIREDRGRPVPGFLVVLER